MPSATSEPAVSLSFANNFWGKEDAGVGPLLERMHEAKTVCEELKTFYTTRSTIEDEYAKKLLLLSKKPLGSCETGSLKSSMDTLRTEVELMAKAHQNVAGQMKTELEEPLAAFSGAMRERRKIVQGGCEKLLKLKMTQTLQVTKTRDRYEQDCLKIKGYLAQGHMVMGQEERKNKARLEKTQIALAGSNAEYENAIKALEETTGRWNRDWKAACDKFQDLEEERIDFLKSSLWTFANIASTVCVSDDASCEKVRISLEDCEVEKDITSFIMDRGTGQEIPDAPKYINFCRGDISDDGASDVQEENYSVAQFHRAGNPSFRSSSPNPSSSSGSQSSSDPVEEPAPTARRRQSPEQEPQPEQQIARRSRDDRRDRERERRDRERQEQDRREQELRDQDRRDRRDSQDRRSRRTIEQPYTPTSREMSGGGTPPSRSRRGEYQLPAAQQQSSSASSTPSRSQRHAREQERLRDAPHNEYPLDGMTMYCRPGTMISDTDSSRSPVARPPSSHASGSDYSNPTSLSSAGDHSQAAVRPGPPRGITGSPTKPSPHQMASSSRDDDKMSQKRKSGFFSSGGPFRRKSKSEKDQRQQQLLLQQQQEEQQQSAAQEQRRLDLQQKQQEQAAIMPPPSLNNRNTWGPTTAQKPAVDANGRNGGGGGGYGGSSNSRQRRSQQMPDDSQEPVDPRATLALNVGGNVFDVSTPDVRSNRQHTPDQPTPQEDELDLDPIAQALAELKDVTKQQPSSRSTGDRNTADRFFGLATPAPTATPGPSANSALVAAQRGTPPPNYAPKTTALGLPPPAFTSAQMQETTQRYQNQRDSMFDGPPQMPAAIADSPRRDGSGRQRARTMDYQRTQSRQSTREDSGSRQGGGGSRAVSPAPNSHRSVSPRPQMYGDSRSNNVSPKPSEYGRGPSPNPYTQSRPGTANSNKYTAYSQRSPSPLSGGQEVALSNYRAHSPAPSHHSHHSRGDSYGSRSRAGSTHGGGYEGSRNSYYSGGEGSQAGAVATYQGGGGQVARPRSGSVVDTTRKYSRQGKPILHYARAMYVYQAAIPAELSFAKGDILAVLFHQEDGWWEAEIVGVEGKPGLVPSNYLQKC